jgi:hypothetical protein
LPGVVFQYLIYTDGTDNLKYVTKEQRRCGDFLQKYYRTQLVWDGIAAGGEMENLKKTLLNVRPKQNGLLNGNI